MLKPYHFIYTDSTHYTLDLSPDDVRILMDVLHRQPDRPFVVLSFGAVALTHLRMAVEMVEKPVHENESATPPEYATDEWLYKQKTKVERDDDEDGEEYGDE